MYRAAAILVSGLIAVSLLYPAQAHARKRRCYGNSGCCILSDGCRDFYTTIDCPSTLIMTSYDNSGAEYETWECNRCFVINNACQAGPTAGHTYGPNPTVTAGFCTSCNCATITCSDPDCIITPGTGSPGAPVARTPGKHSAGHQGAQKPMKAHQPGDFNPQYSAATDTYVFYKNIGTTANPKNVPRSATITVFRYNGTAAIRAAVGFESPDSPTKTPLDTAQLDNFLYKVFLTDTSTGNAVPCEIVGFQE